MLSVPLVAAACLFGAGGPAPAGAVLFSQRGVTEVRTWGITQDGDVWGSERPRAKQRGAETTRPASNETAKREAAPEAAAAPGGAPRLVIPARQMALIQTMNEAQQCPKDALLILRSGEALRGRVRDSERPGGVQFESRLFGARWHDLAQVREVRFAEAFYGAKGVSPPFVVLRNNDIVAGAIKAVGPQGVKIESVFGVTQIEQSRLATVVLSTEANAKAAQADGYVVELTDGQKLHATALAKDVAGDSSVILHWGQGQASIRISQISRAVFPGWSYWHLCELGEPKITTVPYFDEPVRINLDRNAAGGPLLLAGRHYAHGLSTQPRSRVSFAADGKYEFVWGLLGLDAYFGKLGTCEVRVEADGREVFSRAGLTAAAGVQHVAGSIEAAERLDLITDFGRRGSMGDCVNWCDVIVIGPSAGGIRGSR